MRASFGVTDQLLVRISAFVRYFKKCEYNEKIHQLFLNFKEEEVSVKKETFYNISINVRFEVFTAVTMKNGVFWDITLCGSCKSRRFGETAPSLSG
jgi:hypothetical protein